MAVRVSVTIPAFNREVALAACLSALAHQDLPANQWEAIVVADGSTDGTLAVAEGWRQSMPLTAIESGAQIHEALRYASGFAASGVPGASLGSRDPRCT
ncbi:MAG: glycosyltransferase [Acidobacteriota bacterium]